MPGNVLENFDEVKNKGVDIAGKLGDKQGLPPPPDSWASEPGSDLGIYTIQLSPGAQWTLPAAESADTRRVLYFFKGGALQVAGKDVPVKSVMVVQADHDCTLVNGDAESELLVLQARLLQPSPKCQHQH